MTDLRTAAQQALEALGKINKLSVGENAICLPAEIDGAMDALRAALAEPEPRNQCGETCQRAKLCAVCARGLAEPGQEPVTWGVDWGRDGDQSCVSIIKKHADGTAEVVAVEYSPPQRKPLTDEEIDYWIGSNSTKKALARAIEAAHGIGEKK